MKWNDPVGDIRLHLALMKENQHNNGAPLIVGAKIYDTMTEILGRPPTVADIPPGVPGNWTEIIRA